LKIETALHKMAEESRTNGLRLDDWDKIGCVNHDCDKCKAVQEPWGYLEIEDIESQREYPHNCRNVNLWHEGGEGMTAIYIAPPTAQTAYDQTALELCNVCGWKTLIPDDVCLNCEYEKNAAQPAPDEEKNT
jgi:hypothetical protein